MDAITQLLAHALSDATGSVGFSQALMAIGVAYAGGVLSSLTPCVYPMIPITIGVVGGVAPTDPHSRAPWREVIMRGMAYVFGMAVTYSFLGVVAGLTGKVFGSLTNTSGWYLTLSAVITFAALIMMDVIPFDPAFWVTQVRHQIGWRKQAETAELKREVTALGAFSLGASSGFIAAPCTTPVLTAILSYIAQSQSVGLGLALMLAFSFGLGTLLLLLAAFAGTLQLLPRSGLWMKRVKTASGLVLLLFGQYLAYRAGLLGGVR